jgi:hypothetical protein
VPRLQRRGEGGAMSLISSFLRWIGKRLGQLGEDLEPVRCTGLSARWCPRCGNCTCRDPEGSLDDWDCPLHGEFSRHGDWPEREDEEGQS